MWGGSIRFTTSMLFAIAFLFTLTIGGLRGVTFATAPIDWQVTDTYYFVAHMHYVLFDVTLFGVMAGIYYWFPKMSGRLLSERWGAYNMPSFASSLKPTELTAIVAFLNSRNPAAQSSNPKE